MKIYVSHASSFDYQTELYAPLQENLSEHELVLPHSISSEGILASEIIPISDLVVADVTYPSTGQGIELGWANAAQIPIIAVHKATARPSDALRFVTADVNPYTSTTELLESIKTAITKLS